MSDVRWQVGVFGYAPAALGNVQIPMPQGKRGSKEDVSMDFGGF